MTRRRHVGVLACAAAVAVALAAPAAAPAAGRWTPGIWLARSEVMRLPMQGPAWAQLRRFADKPVHQPNLSNQDSRADVKVLAAALVYARTGDKRLRSKVADALMKVIGTERDGRTLALARGLVAYVVAADLINLRRYDPSRARAFGDWLASVRNEPLEPHDYPTLVTTHELRPNNWGTHAGASRIAADIYLRDASDLARAAAVFKGWLGDRAVYAGFQFGEDLSWQADPQAPVGVNPLGATRDGNSIDGALPDDMRRGCSLRFPPCPTLYAWEAMQGAVVQAELLARQGYDAWNWNDQALRRAASFLFDLHTKYGAEAWAAPSGHAWIPWLLNARYGTHFPTALPAAPGKGMGFTDWTDAAGCPLGDCTKPRGGPRQVVPVAAPRPLPSRSKSDDDAVPPLAFVVAGLVLVAVVLVIQMVAFPRAIRNQK
jgi:hypothetical protein